MMNEEKMEINKIKLFKITYIKVNILILILMIIISLYIWPLLIPMLSDRLSDELWELSMLKFSKIIIYVSLNVLLTSITCLSILGIIIFLGLTSAKYINRQATYEQQSILYNDIVDFFEKQR